VVCGFFALALVLTPLERAAAQEVLGPEVSGPDKAALEARKEALFQQMFRDPANLDVTFAYADVSARLGDYEAAVSALERMLLFNPDLPRVQLELGALYYRMGSYDLARDYFDKAAAANPPPEVRARVEQYLADIERSQSRHHLSGYVFFGGQYQTDANVAGSSLILSPIGPVVLGNQFVKQASGSIFGSGSLLYSYDMETQNHDALEVTSVGYLNHYFNAAVNRLDLSLLEVTGGPRFNFPSGLIGAQAASLKPYIIGDEVGLGWNQYFAAGGTGIEYDEIVWNDLALKAAFEFRHKNYTNAPDRPLSTGLTGNDKLVTLSVAKPITENTVLNLEFDYLDQLTQLAFYTNTTYAVAGSYRIRYQDPTGFTSDFWETAPFVGRAWSYYAAPDPCCNTSGNAFPGVYPNGFSTQLTQRWRFGVTQTWPVTATIAVVAQLERDIVSSNLPLYSYNNTSILIGPQIRF
jgi:tetratricopeptide (TPR) repeat protein